MVRLRPGRVAYLRQNFFVEVTRPYGRIESDCSHQLGEEENAFRLEESECEDLTIRVFFPLPLLL